MLSILKQLSFEAPEEVTPAKIQKPAPPPKEDAATARYLAAMAPGEWMTSKQIADVLGRSTVSVTERMRTKGMRDCTERRTLRRDRGIYYEWRLCTKSPKD